MSFSTNSSWEEARCIVGLHISNPQMSVVFTWDTKCYGRNFSPFTSCKDEMIKTKNNHFVLYSKNIYLYMEIYVIYNPYITVCLIYFTDILLYTYYINVHCTVVLSDYQAEEKRFLPGSMKLIKWQSVAKRLLECHSETYPSPTHCSQREGGTILIPLLLLGADQAESKGASFLSSPKSQLSDRSQVTKTMSQVKDWRRMRVLDYT